MSSDLQEDEHSAVNYGSIESSFVLVLIGTTRLERHVSRCCHLSTNIPPVCCFSYIGDSHRGCTGAFALSGLPLQKLVFLVLSEPARQHSRKLEEMASMVRVVHACKRSGFETEAYEDCHFTKRDRPGCTWASQPLQVG